VRDWTASLGGDMVAHGCYDKRRDVNIAFSCISCGRVYGRFREMLSKSIDEYDGRVYSELRYCRCNDANTVLYEEDGTYSCDGLMQVVAFPNAALVSKVGTHPLSCLSDPWTKR
jgi:hypothetical protein